MKLLLLLLPFSISFEYCPCDTDPGNCELHCCCDTDCTAEQASSFTCQPFFLSDSMLCCQDSIEIVDGNYQNLRECSNHLACLEEMPSGYGLFSNNSDSVESQLSYDLGSDQYLITYTENFHYNDTDLLLKKESSDSSVAPFMFPVQVFGDLCAMSPILFYAEMRSTCRRSLDDISTICSTKELLDYEFYLGSLMKYPNETSGILELGSNVDFYCLDSKTGVKVYCDPATKSPKIISDKCVNAVSEIQIYLVTASDAMNIESSSVTVTLTSFPSDQTTFTQTFSLTYIPASNTKTMSGNFGYLPRSSLLSGTLSDDKNAVIMNSDPKLRLLSMFKSSDCSSFSDHTIEFGIEYYSGCKLTLPFYNFQVMSEALEKYCSVLHAFAENVLKAPDSVVVGMTGGASTGDPTQWVSLATEPDTTEPSSSENRVACDDIPTHRTYSVWYSEIGELGNLQAVITRVSVQYTRQNVELYCNSNTCNTARQQHLILSNSVQFLLNTPQPETRFKPFPRTALLLPADFFYPLTAGVRGFCRGDCLWWAVIMLGWVWNRLVTAY